MGACMRYISLYPFYQLHQLFFLQSRKKRKNEIINGKDQPQSLGQTKAVTAKTNNIPAIAAKMELMTIIVGEFFIQRFSFF